MGDLIHPRLPEILRKRMRSRVEVWRDPDQSAEAPHANSDDFGFPVESAPAVGENTGRRLVATYDAEYGPVKPGSEEIVVDKVTVVAPYQFSFLQVDQVDIDAGDRLIVDGDTYSVIHPGGKSTHRVFQVARCQQITQ